MLPQFFARRYLFSPKSRSVVNLISGLSVVAVAMPVAAKIILLSVFNGFESLVKSMYSAFDADLTVSARLGQTFPADAIDTAAVARCPGVEAFSFVLEQSALLEHAGRQATATVRGVDDAYAGVFPLDSVVSAGEYRVRLGDIERLVMGQSMTYMLGIRSLADADVNVYAVRRGSFSSLLPFDNYTRRTVPSAGFIRSTWRRSGHMSWRRCGWHRNFSAIPAVFRGLSSACARAPMRSKCVRLWRGCRVTITASARATNCGPPSTGS